MNGDSILLVEDDKEITPGSGNFPAQPGVSGNFRQKTVLKALKILEERPY